MIAKETIRDIPIMVTSATRCVFCGQPTRWKRNSDAPTLQGARCEEHMLKKWTEGVKEIVRK